MSYKKIISLVVLIFFLAGPVTAGAVSTTYTITDADATVAQMALNTASLSYGSAGPGSGLSSGSHIYNYVAVTGVTDTSGSYTLGQTAAPVDTVMLVYSGTFDPANPVAPVAFNDDSMSGDT